MNGDGGVHFKAWLTSVLYKYSVLIEAPNIEWPDWVEYEVTGGTRLNFKLINQLPSETESHTKVRKAKPDRKLFFRIPRFKKRENI